MVTWAQHNPNPNPILPPMNLALFNQLLSRCPSTPPFPIPSTSHLVQENLAVINDIKIRRLCLSLVDIVDFLCIVVNFTVLKSVC